MALQPEDRPAGSAQVLRFNGVVSAGVALDVFPKENGTITTGGADTDVRGMRFLLADATDLANQQKRFPSHVYDDTQPAGAAPHAPVATSLVALVVNADEEDIELCTWAQNLYVFGKILSTNVASVDTEDCLLVRDTLTSGLGLNTGLPVLIVPISLSVPGDATFDILIEIRQTASR